MFSAVALPTKPTSAKRMTKYFSNEEHVKVSRLFDQHEHKSSQQEDTHNTGDHLSEERPSKEKDSDTNISDATDSSDDLESVFSEEEMDPTQASVPVHENSLERSQILREDLKKVGLLSENQQANEEINPKAFKDTGSDDKLPDILNQMYSNGYVGQRYDLTDQASDSDLTRSRLQYATEDNDYGDDERDWIVDELAKAGTGSQVPHDDFVWSDTDEDLMETSEPKSPTTSPYDMAETVMRDDGLSNQNNEDIMMMSPTNYIATTPVSQLKSTFGQGVNFAEPDYLMPDFGTDSSGEFHDEHGVSGNYGDIGDEVDLEVIRNVKKSKVARPTDALENKTFTAMPNHISAKGKFILQAICNFPNSKYAHWILI